MSDRFATTSGSAIYVEESGAGPAIVSVHGLGGGAWFFTALGRRLADDCRLIAIDLPGTGRSGAAARPSIDLWVADLRELIERHVGEPAVLLGHSMGTIIALEAAAAWPSLLRGVVFAGGLPEPLPHIKERLASRAGILERDGIEGTGKVVAAANFSPAILSSQPELVALFARLIDLQDPAAYAHACRVLMNASAEPVVERVNVPALSISGADDQYAPPDRVTAFVRRLRHCRQEILPGCGHFPFLEQPGRFAELVLEFVTALWWKVREE